MESPAVTSGPPPIWTVTLSTSTGSAPPVPVAIPVTSVVSPMMTTPFGGGWPIVSPNGIASRPCSSLSDVGPQTPPDLELLKFIIDNPADVTVAAANLYHKVLLAAVGHSL